MTELTLLRQMEESNKDFLAGNARYLDAAGEPFVVITCIDPRLTGFLEPALGLPRHRAVVIRTAGNQISERTKDELRSIAAAVYIKKASEIFIVGHTDCSMAAFSVSEVTDAFRKVGVPRSAFGDDDLRVWFGAFANIRNNVISSGEFLTKSGILPRSIKIHGLIFETNLGSIEVVLDGDLASQGAARPPLEPEPAKAADPVAEGRKDERTKLPPKTPPLPPIPDQGTQKSRAGPIVIGEPPVAMQEMRAEVTPDSLLAATLVVRNFIHQERNNQKLQKSIANLKQTWLRKKSPSRIFTDLASIAKEYEKDYPNLRGALLYLENAVKSGSTGKIGIVEIMKRLLD
jgi:carbonic anhydrase